MRAAHCTWIWAASSRVGESTIACTPRGSAPARAASRSTVGRRNASVLPEPVLALAMTSWPARASGSVCDCTSVHSTKRRTSLIALDEGAAGGGGAAHRFEAAEMESSLNACTGPTLVDGDGASFFFVAPSSAALADGVLGRLPTAAGASGLKTQPCRGPAKACAGVNLVPSNTAPANGALGLFLAPSSTALAKGAVLGLFFTALANGVLVAFFLASASRALEQKSANADL
eukprot:scaffold54498_cov63-Phaeocystis_antarctica.AAC.3